MSISWTWFTFLVVLLFAVLWMDQRRPSGSHSLRYSFSLLSEPLPGAPQYSVVGHVNDVVIISYTSESGMVGPRAPWMENITDQEPKYWDDSRETFEEVKKKLSDSLRNQMEQKNQSPGLHVFQAMLGCELREDESVKWFERYAYDGSNYTSNLDPAAETQDQRNSEESFECMKELKKLLHYGEKSLRRRGPHGRSGQGQLLLLVASLVTVVLLGAVVFFWKPLKSFFTTHCRWKRGNEAQPSGGENEGVEMVPLQMGVQQ